MGGRSTASSGAAASEASPGASGPSPAALQPDERRVVDVLLRAYRQGAFPMASSRTSEDVAFYTADPRAIIPVAEGDPLGRFHVSRSLQRRVRSGRFAVTCDAAFERVIRACAEVSRPHGESTWINDQIIAAYTILHRAGHAHSVEAWRPEPEPRPPTTPPPGPGWRLVGGLYGTHLGAAFFGESMFARPDLGGTDASKVCLVHLVAHLRRRGITLLDTQFANDHTRRFGLVEIPLADYLRRLEAAVDAPVSWGSFQAGPGDAPGAG